MSITLWPVDDTSAFCTSSSLAAAAFSAEGKRDAEKDRRNEIRTHYRTSTPLSTITLLCYVKNQRVNKLYIIYDHILGKGRSYTTVCDYDAHEKLLKIFLHVKINFPLCRENDILCQNKSKILFMLVNCQCIKSNKLFD